MKVDIEIFNIAKTTVDKNEVRRWLDHLNVSQEWDFPSEEIVNNPALNIALAAKRCYMSFEVGLNPNISKVRSDYGQYFDNILNSGHGSVLEHSVFTFAIEGVSRVFTAEMNRHRAGWAISEGSLRFIRFDKDIPYWLPDSISGEDVEQEQFVSAIVNNILNDKDNVALRAWISYRASKVDLLELRKQLSRAIFTDVFKYVEKRYGNLLTIWDMNEADKDFSYKKKVTSCLRRIVPLGVATGGVWSGNVRALRHVLTMRCSEVAEEEICHVFSRIAKKMSEEHPLLFGDFYKDENGYWRPKYVKV